MSFARLDPGISTSAGFACVLAAAVLGAAMACGDGDGGVAPTPPEATLAERALAAGLAPLPEAPPRPLENPLVQDRVELGRLLFFDPVLSGPRDLACSTCHLPGFAFADGRQFSVGAGGHGLGPDRSMPEPPLRPMPRNTPTVFNAGLYGRSGTTPTVNGMMFWSGGAFGIEDQVLNPISADKELRGLTYAKVVAQDSVLTRLRALPEYLDRFAAAFPEIEQDHGLDADRLVTATTLRRALAAYIRELVTPQAPLDRFLRGDDGALGPSHRAGLELFIGKAGCVGCHSGPLLSDFQRHVLGTRQDGLGRDTTPGDDLGWGESGGTPYAFRTPPLRQVELTAPYFHAGTAVTLDEVIRFKNAGTSAHPGVPPDDLDPLARPLGLSESEMADLTVFLNALTDRVTVQGPLFQGPDRVPSGLEVPK